MTRVPIILLLLLPFVQINGQEQSMLIKKKSGELQTISVDKIEEVCFVQTGDVQRNKWYFMLENPGISDFLRDFDYDSNDYSYHKIFDYRGEPYLDQRQDWPYGAELVDTIIYNLIPNRKYEIKSGGMEYKFWTIGKLRMLRLQGLNNVRDLGGWETPKGHLRYGCIIRGPELKTTLPANDAQAAYHNATDDDIFALRQDVGIRAELDLRSSTEINAPYSALGMDIKYLNHPSCSPNPITQPSTTWLQPLQFILSCLSQQMPVYVHCRWGADRTGLLCMLIEGVLGVSESDLAKDYELTSFSGNTRYRTDERFRKSIEYIKTLPGESLQDKFQQYWLACGATLQEIEQLATLMIE